jgi:hypothetical protein
MQNRVLPLSVAKVASVLAFLVAALTAVPSLAAEQDALTPSEPEASQLYTIKFVGKSLAAAMGPMVRENRSHSRNPAGRLVLDVRAPDSVRYLEEIRTNHDRMMSDVERLLDRSVPVVQRLDVVLNGVMVRMTDREAQQVANLPFVEFVEQERIDQLHTFAGPAWIGAESIWDGSATVSGVGNRGEGMIAAVIDSGINTQNHPSFAAVSDDGYNFVNPLGPGNFLGDCIGGTTGNNLVQCNAKLIGAYGFIGGTPEDTLADVGHGSHTASTMAGNVVFGPFTSTTGVVPAAQIAGVAPRANIIAYRACAGTSGCPGGATSAGLQQALIDGANATNYSIGPTVGGRGISPWTSSSERIMLDLVAAGLFTAASAGNTRQNTNNNPEADVANKGPWIATVANSSHGGFVAHQAAFVDSGTPVTGLDSVLAVPGTGPQLAVDLDAPVFSALATDAANAEGCTAWNGTPFAGGIALISRGSCNFSVKVDNASAAGAIGVIVHNNVSGPPIAMAALETTTIPAVMIPQADGQAANGFIAGSAAATATINAQLDVLLVEEFGNALNAGSLKGPNLDFDVTEPNINAPGTNILAANAAGDVGDFRFLTGTSMSGPHIAGAGLLMLAEHPEWTPTEALSAMMMTANPVGTKPTGLPTDPDDVGSGTADLTRASLAGLVMGETFDNFLAANPATGGDPRTLNLPSMRHSTCNPGCSWTRTVRNALDADASWSVAASGDLFDVSVSPTSFDLLAGDVIFRDALEDGSEPNSSFQQLEITVTNNTAGAQMRFGELILTEATEQAPSARMTIAVSQSLPPAPPI